KVAGVRIGELFPQIAAITDRIAIVRSLHTGSNDHGIAGTMGLTGSIEGGVGLNGKPLAGGSRPATGSVVARVRTLQGPSAGGRGTPMPPFMVIGGKLHQGKKPIIGEGGGPLGSFYDPFRLVHDPVHGTRIPALQLPDELNPDRLGSRQQLAQTF